ncbi:MAG: hypothetical protein AAGF85_01900 [Bacteroidota bacterium]
MAKLLVGILIFFSCASPNKDKPQENAEKDVQENQFLNFIDQFRKKKVIKINDVNRYTKSSFTEERISSIESLELLIESDGLYAVMYKVNCKAGGECQGYYISTFDKKGEHITSTEIGETVSDSEGGKYFEYQKISSKELIITHELEDYSDESDSNTLTKSQVLVNADGTVTIKDNI